MKLTCITQFSALLLAVSLTSTQAALVHRYSFTADVSDSVGVADGVVVDAGAGTNFTFTGGMLDLSANLGEGSNGIVEDAYVDLPNGIVSGAAGSGSAGAITFEFWVTVAETHTWQRFGDFGTSNNGEDTSASGNASAYLLVTPNSGRFTDGLEATNHPASNAAEPGVGLGGPFPIGVEAHVVAVYDHSDTTFGANGTMSLYLDGGLVGTNEIHPDLNIPTMLDNNNWLGRSQWNDAVFDGSYNEFRIYDHALNDAQVTASFNSGADTPVDFDVDRDGDGMPDIYEDQFAFLDRSDPDDAAEDEDTDGLTNLEEFEEGTKPDVADTDGDGLDDGPEVKTHGTNPLIADTDEDGLSDGDEINVHSTFPLDSDSDDDLIADGYETLYAFLDPLNPADAADDEEPDGLTNLEEYAAGTEPDNEDTDSDELIDGDEVINHGTMPLVADTDGDGLGDGSEVNDHGTMPLIADTDADGINDGPEVAAGLDPLVADATTPSAIHRYSFNFPSGAAPADTVIADLIGDANGIIVGANGVWTGTALTLPGGAGATADAAYVDLPNGIMSSLDHLTFEAWYTIRTTQNWSRIWDFGSTDGGEVLTGNTGATNGQDYFLFAPSRGTDINLQRHGTRNLDGAAPGGGVGPIDDIEESLDTGLVTTLGQEYHVAGVWTSDGAGGAQLTVYRDGVRQGTRTTTYTPRDINDVNNWLGRSNWTGDNYLNGDLNEFRIYEGAMNDAAAEASFTAGPDAQLDEFDFRMLAVELGPGPNEITITFTSKPDIKYAIDRSTDMTSGTPVLTTPGSWSEQSDDHPSGGETTSYTDTIPAGTTRLFYRAREVPMGNQPATPASAAAAAD